LPGKGDAYLSSIWVEDAARAIVVALAEAPAGVYDVVDDEPLTRDAFDEVLAQSVGRRRLWRVPSGVVKMMAGVAADVASRSLRVSNRRFKEATSWRPEVPDMRKGWGIVAQRVGEKANG
jgi:NAD dependent epimerase/dehydratase family enzyme